MPHWPFNNACGSHEFPPKRTVGNPFVMIASLRSRQCGYISSQSVSSPPLPQVEPVYGFSRSLLQYSQAWKTRQVPNCHAVVEAVWIGHQTEHNALKRTTCAVLALQHTSKGRCSNYRNPHVFPQVKGAKWRQQRYDQNWPLKDKKLNATYYVCTTPT